MKLKKPKFWVTPKISFLAILLYPISLLILLFLYFSKTKSPKKFHIPIICIGNIYLGGTGKTPLALEIYKITKSLSGKGERIFLMAPLRHHFEITFQKKKWSLK